MSTNAPLDASLRPSGRPKAGPLTTIVFDIGGVLVDWNPRYLFRRIIDDEARMEWFLAHVCNDDWNREQDRGRSFADAVAERVALHADWEREIRAYDARWPEMLAGAIEGSVAVLQELQARGWPTFGLTNFSREKFDIACANYPFLATFEGVLVSADEKLVKPDAAVFERFLERFGREAQECFFVDDVERNVAAARQVGIHAVHFVGAEKLRQDLRALGIL